MSVLSDREIEMYLIGGEIDITPMNPDQVQPASVDLRLGSHFLKVKENKTGVITLDDEIEYESIEADEIIIPPHSFLLATTVEHVKLPSNITASVEGRSSIGRIGLFIQNAGWVDPGFVGQITLELYNANSLPIKLQAGRRICQLVFERMEMPADNPYRGKYQGQTNATGSRVFLDAEVSTSKQSQAPHRVGGCLCEYDVYTHCPVHGPKNNANR